MKTQIKESIFLTKNWVKTKNIFSFAISKKFLSSSVG